MIGQIQTKSIQSRGENRTNLMAKIGDYWTLCVLVVIIAIFGILAPRFLSAYNFLSTTTSATEILLLAIGETFVIITSGIDLSVGAVLGLSGITGGMCMQLLGNSALSLIVGSLVSLVTGLIFGTVNGFVVAKMKITPFIATLGTMGIASGVTFLLSNGADITSLPTELTSFGNGNIGKVLSYPVLITIVLCIISGIALAKTKFGVHTYAIGSNEEAARRTGINVPRHIVKIYALSGLMAGISGLIVAARFASASPISGQNDELNAIAAVVIGGASLFGGRGTVLGSVVGSIIIAVLASGLVILNVQAYWQTVAVGAIIIAAVFVEQLRHKTK
ncbi:ABC transporter permease [Alicyclobacillus fastidiosus]|uniref:ABC transporter permease n=1 Tax=Alicyclobacillus fastidiosus TaxID=392011 RepID=A0ABY6ZCP8_9BACL|nr:ABC transporter permease [Alicyclobacillus fastidiosus]WAH40669.1 ABC transporter permease [Alicyclobacillus fastidiosus]GMA62131.1 sugar ABC transporter permease [Alicyclobacillus fastidiosus]